MSLKKKSLGIILGILCFFALFQVNTFAAEKGQVHVIVENTTATKESGAAWDGNLFDTYVDITDDMTALSAIQTACANEKKDIKLNQWNGIETIENLSTGWMCTLNDWFTNNGLLDYKISDGSLKAGDELRVMYSSNWGEDIGSIYNNNDKSLKALTFSSGTISPAFQTNTKSYTLTVSDGVKEVKVIPTAANKNFQVKTIVGSKEYDRTQAVPVAHGSKFQVVCGRTSWPTMNNSANVSETSYTVTVKTKEGIAKESVSPKIKLSGESKSCQSTKVTWNKISGVSKYQVYRKASKNGTYKKVKTTTARSFTDTKKKTGTTYYYKVRAYKIYGSKTFYGAFSNVKTIKVVPAQVSIQKVSQKGSYLKTNWKKVSGADGYRVYIKVKGAKNYQRVYQCGKNKLAYTKKTGMTKKTYSVKVRAYKKVKNKKVFGKYSKVKIITMKLLK
ncbi:MAG: cadherin-like beta sandwich domain-containing protein [Anaerostipes sp.]|nr:cadherin-like beta sandwich domain-containing protein [Anaerostipes sp.]